MLFKSAKLGAEELRVIKSISAMHKSLKYALSTPPRWNGTLRRNTFARAIQGSNSIEGYLVSAEDAIAAVEGEDPLDANRETWLAITGYRNAMTFVLQLVKDPNFMINEGFLRSFHFMMIQYDLSKHPGNWRPGSIWVRDEDKKENVYEAPPSEKIPELITELIHYLQSPQDDDHMLIKAAMAHLNLVMIHPFSDGNGRMSRCLQSLVLATGLEITGPTFSSIEEYLGRNTRIYYDVLGEVGQGSWNPQNDTRRWIHFSLIAHYRQAATSLRRTRVIAKLWDYLEREIKERKLPERSIFALSDAAMGYSVRAAHYKFLTEVSDVMASRDLKTLVDFGMLIPIGERRGRIYKASDELKTEALKIRNEEPTQIHDPFETKEALIGI